LGHAAHFKHGMHPGTQERLQFGRVVIFPPFGDDTEIAAGAKCAARSGNNHYIDGFVSGQAAKAFVESDSEVFVNGIQLVRAV